MSGRTVDGMSKGPKHFLFVASLLLAGLPTLSFGQNPPPAKKLPTGPPSPQSTHYPILILAFGNDPNWSLRIGPDIRPSLSNLLMSLTRPVPTPGPITPRTPPPVRSSSST